MTLRGTNSIRFFLSAPSVSVMARWLLVGSIAICFAGSVFAQENEAQVKAFDAAVLPVLESYCADCHLDGADEGGVTLDVLVDPDKTAGEKKLWDRALKQLRHDLMPPRDMDQPTAAEQTTLENWIKAAVFDINPKDPDPGHVIVRRLNRIEYRNTIKDLFDYEINTELLFPPDDTGHGFDNMAQVLTLSPLLMEKYIDAATEVVMARVPVVSRAPNQRWFTGEQYEVLQSSKPRASSASSPAAIEEPEGDDKEDDDKEEDESDDDEPEDDKEDNEENATTDKENSVELVDIEKENLMFFYSGGGKAKLNFEIDQAGKYDLLVMLATGEDYVDGVFDANRCRVKIECDGETIADQEYAREGWVKHRYVVSKDWEKGDHWLTVDVTPLTNEKHVRRLRLEIGETILTGPLNDPESFVFPERHAEFFPDAIPKDNEGRKQYARKLISGFAKKAFRRPPEPETVAGLVELAESVWSVQGSQEATFERGIAQAMTAILSSPNFIFRETFPVNQAADVGNTSVPAAEKETVSKALIDEHSLATRLSYFLWSTMPDDSMIKLADEGKLRSSLDEVVNRMVNDDRFGSFYKDFMGQWLRTRDIEGVAIDSMAILLNEQDSARSKKLHETIERLQSIKDSLTKEQRKELRATYKQMGKLFKKVKKFALDGELRRSMRRESEMLFEHIVKADSDLVQLIDCDFTFLNERLARHYGIEGVDGKEMRLVKLKPETHRGGILTHGSFLAVTSNPDRTSPVKRGMFILDNLLGMPPGSPPPNVPDLEDSSGEDLTKFTLRKSLALHREDPMCSSCHNRMDPLGLALENFDALGRYRTQQAKTEIDASGELISGESFENIDDLKKILVSGHKEKFYRCVTEKLMIYALGRPVKYYDLQTIDDIVASLLKEGGKPSVLLSGIVESPAFQMTRLESTSPQN